jgi:hypothetical protein
MLVREWKGKRLAGAPSLTILRLSVVQRFRHALRL